MLIVFVGGGDTLVITLVLDFDSTASPGDSVGGNSVVVALSTVCDCGEPTLCM